MRLPQPSNLGRFAIAAATLALATAAIYSGVGSFDFTNFDDPDYVARNDTVQRGLTFEGIRWAFTTNFMGNWHPLTWLSHMLDCQFFGPSPGAHHWVSVFFHIGNSVLLFWVLYRYTNALGRSSVVAALFAFHPLHVESVAWIAERKDLLCAFFWILTMWAYLRYVETRSDRHYGLVLLYFALGLMTKPMLVTLPFVLLLLDYWPLRRVAIRWDWLRLTREKLPLFVLTFLSSIVTFIVQKQGGAVGSLEKFAPDARVANALVAYVAYLGKTILPENLAAFYPHPGAWPKWQVAGAGVLMFGLTIVALSLRRRATYLMMGWLWYIGTLVPVIGLVQVGDQAYADRYTYIPLIGIFIAVVWAIADLATRLHRPALPLRATAATLLLAYGTVAAYQVTHWRNSETLFGHALAVTKDNYVAHYNLGETLSVHGRILDAIEHYHATLRLKPDHEGAHNNLGLTLALQGRWQEATNHYTAALSARPASPEVHFNMGIAQMNLGDMTSAVRHLTLTLQQLPSHPLAHRYLGAALAAAGQVQQAILEYRRALKVSPNQPEVLNDLAWLLATHPDPAVRNGTEAVQLAERASQLTDFNSPSMLGTLAAAYAEAGQFEHAARTARRAESIATQQGNSELASKYHTLLEKYEQRQPHRE
jgi:protein O-mannosyl-transferase